MKLDISTDLRGICQININDVDEADKPRVEKFLELVVNYLNAQIDNDTSEEKKADLEVPVPTKANGQAFYEYTLSVSNLDEAELTLANGNSIKEAYEAILEYPVPSKQSEETKGQFYVHLNTYFDLDPQTTSVDQVYSVFFVRDVANVGQILESFTAANTKEVPTPPGNPPKAPLMRKEQNSEEKVIINFQAASDEFMISIAEAIMYFTHPDRFDQLLIMCDTLAPKGDENELVFSYIGDDKNSKTALNEIKKLTRNEVQAAVANIRNKQNKATGSTNPEENININVQQDEVSTNKNTQAHETNEELATSAAGNEAENTTEQPIASIKIGENGEYKITIDLDKAAGKFSINVEPLRKYFSNKYKNAVLHDPGIELTDSESKKTAKNTLDLYEINNEDLARRLQEINALTQENYQPDMYAELDDDNADAFVEDFHTAGNKKKHEDPAPDQRMNRHDPRLPLAGNLTDAAPHQPHMSVVAAISQLIPNHQEQKGDGNNNLSKVNSWKNQLQDLYERSTEHQLAAATKSYFDHLAKTEKAITTNLKHNGELTVKQNADTILHMAAPDKSGNVKTEHNGSNMAWRGVFEGMVAAKHTTCAFTLSDANLETNKKSAEEFVNTLNTMLNDDTKSATLKEIVFTFQDDKTKHLVTQALQKHGETATLALFGLEKVGETVQPTSADTHTDAQKHNTAQISKTALAAPAEAAGRQKQESNALAHAEAAYALKDDLFGQDKHDKRGPHG